MIGFGGHVKEGKRRKEKSELIEGVSLLSAGRSMEGLQASARVVEEEEESCENRRSND